MTLFLLAVLAGCSSDSRDILHINIESKEQAPQVVYALNKLRELSKSGVVNFSENNPDYVIHTSLNAEIYEPEAFGIFAEGNRVRIEAGDAAGLMYGLLDIKEQLENGQTVLTGKKESPHLAFRAIKFNLPWMSYRTGEALQLHTETVRDTSFWHAFLDMMAENRFNALTLWSQHPFHYMVKTEKFPEACGFSDEEMAGWKKFWEFIFREAKNRGIETYIVNWNIFVSPEFAKAHGVAEYSINNEYFINKGDTSGLVKDYMRESVKAVIDTYPDLTGLGISLGEGMGGMMPEEREKWLLESIVKGAREASRKIKFIHRIPFSAGTGSGGSTSTDLERMTRRTLDTLSCFIKPIYTELKFNWSHAHSTPSLVKVHGGELTDTYWKPVSENYKLAWMMRNEDFFMLRWGQPEYIRNHIDQNVHPYVIGYYVGSECYIPAKDYFTTVKGASNKYAFERQWMFYKNWGRLLYNPKTPDSVFELAFVNRFREYGKKLFEAQKKVSRIPLIIASYWNATWDFTLYSEGFLTLDNDEVKLISLKQLSEKQPMEPVYMSVSEFLENGEMPAAGKITPLALADSIDAFCLEALETVKTINPNENTDLLYEVADIKAWAYLGLYFSDKLRSAVEYKKFITSGDPEIHKRAVLHLENAAGKWEKLAEVTGQVYEPVPLMHYTHTGGNKYFHWSNLEREVVEELKGLKNLLRLKE